MKKFLEEYGMAILTSIVVICLIVVSTPIKETINTNIKKVVSNFGDTIAQRIEGLDINLEVGDKIIISGEDYLVLGRERNNNYLVMKINSIGSKVFNEYGNNQNPETCYFENENNLNLSSCNNQYEGSDIDNFLETTYFSSLPRELQEAIVPTEFATEYYTLTQDSSWLWEYNLDGKHPQNLYGKDWYKKIDGIWVYNKDIKYDKNTKGAYQAQFASKSDKTVTRKIFLPSIKDFSLLLDWNNAYQLKTLLYDQLKIKSLMLRDSPLNYKDCIIHYTSIHQSLSRNGYHFLAKHEVYPSLTVDLSKIDFEKK